MKQELLITVVLLAAGGAFWIWQSDSGIADQESLFPTEANHLVAKSQLETQSSGFVDFEDRRGKQLPANPLVSPVANWQDVDQRKNVDQTNAATQQAHYIEQTSSNQSESSRNVPKPSIDPRSIKMDCPAQFRIANSDSGSETLLRQFSAQINQGGPIQSTFKMRSRLFDVELNAEGRFWQIGQGSRKSRMELAFIGQTTQRSLLQICDGRFVFQVKLFDGTQKIGFLDLQRLKNSEAHLATASLPGSWVGRGSLADVFVHLADAFKFNPPVVSTSDSGETVYSISGHWKPDRLHQLLSDIVKPDKLEPVIQLSATPPQLPHAVNVIVKTNPGDSGRLIPVQLEFFRFSEDADGEMLSLVDVRFERFESTVTLDERLFALQSSDGEAVDLTDIYNRRIESLVGGQGRVADVSPVLNGQFGESSFQ